MQYINYRRDEIYSKWKLVNRQDFVLGKRGVSGIAEKGIKAHRAKER